MEAGRMAVLQDPAGASFAVWTPKKHIGASLMAEHGVINWAELETSDVDRAGGFYAKLFSWKPAVQDMGGGRKYTVFSGPDGKTRRAGLMAGGSPSHWNVYFHVDDCDAVAKKAGSLNAKTVMPPTDIPGVGRFAFFTDPQGANFAVLQLKM
jgi:predicted enzyme related to lactoylglutathione lyase